MTVYGYFIDFIFLSGCRLSYVFIISCRLFEKKMERYDDAKFVHVSVPKACEPTPTFNVTRYEYHANVGYIIHSFTGAYSPGWIFGLSFRGFLITHIQTHGRAPLDE
jgi:hypothetical protein